MPEYVFLNSIRNPNIRQKNLFKSVFTVVERNINNDENTAEFIIGGASSNQSLILKLHVEYVKRCYDPTVDAIIKWSSTEVVY
jgi:hypothetical protein